MTGKAPASAGLYEEYLVTLAIGGDREAADRLARRFQPRLLRTARRMLADSELAMSVVQEAWVSILRGLPRLREPASFAPFAFGVLRRRCVDAIRKVQRRRAVFDEGAEAAGGSAGRPDDAIAIKQAFAGLPPDQRLAAHLFFVEGLTLAEIAQVQGVPIGTAKSRLFHARQKLKAALAPFKGEVP
ncbi:RNA polymerase sigma factor [Aurantiacibacter gilvus]|uniref:Sigma-70 family RNA polymerase sigma factor n=1 Tax=Aurantiacibacter gilvus TaxID=3139141 RepID=A0ABU9IEM9_9SPHN